MRTKRWPLVVVALLLAVIAAKVVLFDLAATPSAPYAIDLAALHQAAVRSEGGQEGALPTRIEVERIGDFAFPRSFVVAGGGLFQLHSMILLAHRVVYPDGSVIVDTAMSPADTEAMPGAKTYADAYDRLERALPHAKAIVFTHEHVDHMGGVARAPSYDAVAARTRITREQLDGPKLERDKFAPGRLEKLKSLDYHGLYTVAPGIVLQKAPGHSVGSQLVYVELADGQRYLFVGDVAWSHDNVRLRRGKPALMELLGGEDRAAVASQLAAFATLPADVHLVIAHDPVAYERDLNAGLFVQGFSD